MRTKRSLALCLLILLGILVSPMWRACAWSRIEAVRGKQYHLSKRHGPWMIMVASFEEVEGVDHTEGMSPRQAAEQLVFELRKKGVPAYTYEQRSQFDKINTVDRLGRRKLRFRKERHANIAVLAGNYSGRDNRIAQRTLKHIKKFQPEFLRDVRNNTVVKKKLRDGGALLKLRNGGIYRETPGRPGPLSGAFLTINPMLSPQEIRNRQHDPLLLKLNSQGELSLLNNRGRYTVIVASFYGTPKTKIGGRTPHGKERNLKLRAALDEAAINAWELAKALRKARSLGYDRNYEAYVFHNRYRSIVTIGSFDRPNDPRIARLQRTFGAKVRKIKGAGGRSILTAEVFTIPRRLQPGRSPVKSWLFDARPALMDVPKIH